MPFALRAVADLVIGRAFGRDADFGVADLVIRAGVPFLVARAEPFALRPAADLVVGRAFADFGVAAGLARFAVARFLIAWVDPLALRDAADFAAGRALRGDAFAVPAGLARRTVARLFFIWPAPLANRPCWAASSMSRDNRPIKALP